MRFMLLKYIKRSIARTAKIAKIERKLGFPERPKAPLAPHLRFSKDVRPTLDNVQNRDPKHVIGEIAVLWKAEDEANKELYRQDYEKDMVSVHVHCPISLDNFIITVKAVSHHLRFNCLI